MLLLSLLFHNKSNECIKIDIYRNVQGGYKSGPACLNSSSSKKSTKVHFFGNMYIVKRVSNPIKKCKLPPEIVLSKRTGRLSRVLRFSCSLSTLCTQKIMMMKNKNPHKKKQKNISSRISVSPSRAVFFLAHTVRHGTFFFPLSLPRTYLKSSATTFYVIFLSLLRKRGWD